MLHTATHARTQRPQPYTMITQKFQRHWLANDALRRPGGLCAARRQRALTLQGPLPSWRRFAPKCAVPEAAFASYEPTEADRHSSQAASMSYEPALPDRKQLRDGSGLLMLKNLTLKELEEWCKSIGARQPLPGLNRTCIAPVCLFPGT